jgi:integral membrane protein
MRAFLWVARLEGISFLALVAIAMPLKYGMNVLEPVKQIGRVHGVLTLGFLVLLVVNARRGRWSPRKTGWALLSSMIPLGFVFFEASHRADER